MTTSFERIGPFLKRDVLPTDVEPALEVLIKLYTEANRVAVITEKGRRVYQTLGFINAFFFNDWLKAPTSAEKDRAVENWVRVIAHIRATDNKWLVSVTGAQNLDSRKLEAVRRRVHEWLAGVVVAPAVDMSDTESVETDES